MSGSGCEAYPNIWEGLPTTLDHSQTSGKASRPLPTTPGHPGVPPDHSWTSVRASRPLPVIREGLPTTPDHSRPLPDIQMSGSGREALLDVWE